MIVMFRFLQACSSSLRLMVPSSTSSPCRSMHSSASSRTAILWPLIIAATPGIWRLLGRVVQHVLDLAPDPAAGGRSRLATRRIFPSRIASIMPILTCSNATSDGRLDRLRA